MKRFSAEKFLPANSENSVRFVCVYISPDAGGSAA